MVCMCVYVSICAYVKGSVDRLVNERASECLRQ